MSRIWRERERQTVRNQGLLCPVIESEMVQRCVVSCRDVMVRGRHLFIVSLGLITAGNHPRRLLWN
jgi:hypothetical protein